MYLVNYGDGIYWVAKWRRRGYLGSMDIVDDERMAAFDDDAELTIMGDILSMTPDVARGRATSVVVG